MDESVKPLNMLLLASYFKGERFIKQAQRRGARAFLLTQERLLNKDWPREALVDVFAQPDGSGLDHAIKTVSYLARSIDFDRIVALDDFDVETAAALREHLRVPGMGDTTARHFRDKLAMRVKAAEGGIPIPDFVHVLNHDRINQFIRRSPPPWMLKPRSEASAIGISKIESVDQLWQTIESKGDNQSYFLLEKYLPGDVFHVDSIVLQGRIAFSAVHFCGTPPFDVAHGGGIFTTRTVERGSDEERALMALNELVLHRFGLLRGISHVEFIRARDTGRFFLLEAAARVGGAHIADMIDAATGINLWEEWANLEIDRHEQAYRLPPARQDYAGVVLTLARQESPDTSAYDDPEIVFRAPEKNHAGLVVRSSDPNRVKALLESYSQRFMSDFHASMPVADRSAH